MLQKSVLINIDFSFYRMESFTYGEAQISMCSSPERESALPAHIDKHEKGREKKTVKNGFKVVTKQKVRGETISKRGCCTK